MVAAVGRGGLASASRYVVSLSGFGDMRNLANSAAGDFGSLKACAYAAMSA